MRGQKICESNKVCDKFRARQFINFFGRAELRELAAIHDGDAVGKRERFFLVMRDVNRSDVQAALQIANLKAHLFA